MAKTSTAMLRAPLLAGGAVTEGQLDTWYEALSDPGFAMIDRTTISVWARRPRL